MIRRSSICSKHHKEQTERHEQSLEERLEALGEETSTIKEAGAVGSALLKGVGDQAHSDKPGKNARDGYITGHMEIAFYQLLERLAKKAGDKPTAEVARRNRAEEEAMGPKIDSNWDKFLDLTLREAGVQS